MGGKRLQIIGQKFNHLTVLMETPSTNSVRKYKCQCDCGNTTEVFQSHLTTGQTVSCGCYGRSAHVTHGETGTRLYRTWVNMKTRCANSRAASWKHYGAKGIRVYSGWQDYVEFSEWAYAHGYTGKEFLAREDVTENFKPSNCKWQSSRQRIMK